MTPTRDSTDSNRVGDIAIAGVIERLCAPFVFAVPLVYLTTGHSYSPIIWHYSATLMGAIVVYGLFFALVLMSYRWKTPKWFYIARRITVFTGSWLVFGVLFAEVVLASLYPRPDIVRLRGYSADPNVGYVYTPNYQQEVVFAESVTEWKTNSLGVRADRDHGSKPKGVTRILGLGDSFTVSVATALSEAWPGVLERRLNQEIGPPGTFEVVNAGHAGWGTMQQTVWLRKFGAAFDADVVLLAMTPNDIGDNAVAPPGYFTAVDGYLARRGATQAERVRFEHRIKWYSLPGQIERSLLRRQIRLISPSVPTRVLMPHALEPDAQWRRYQELTEDYLLELRDIAAAQGASFGVILLTFRGQLGVLPQGFSPEVFGKRWSHFADEHDIAVVNTYPIVDAHHDPQSLFWQWDDHYNVAGERCRVTPPSISCNNSSGTDRVPGSRSALDMHHP